MNKTCTERNLNKESKDIIPVERIERSIYIIRGNKVMLDRDLALLYGIETKNLNKAVKRNKERFPNDFMFQLTLEESERSRFQFGTLKRGQNIKYRPYVFTEQGVAMLSSIIRSPQAIKVNIEIMRTFIKLRQALISHTKLTKEFSELKEFVLKNSLHNNREFKKIWNAIEKMTKPKNQRKIGFDLSQHNS